MDVDSPFRHLLQNDKIVDEWKYTSLNWDSLITWLGDFDLNSLTNEPSLMCEETDNHLSQFELVLTLIFAEYAKGLKNFLRC